MKLIVGLGNLGREYERTRHNIGFQVVESLAASAGAVFHDVPKHQAQIAEIELGGKVLLVKPQTYMNLSGNAVRSIADYYKIEPKDIWVVSDDIDLPLGRIRVRDTGTSGGHNGLASIIDSLATEDFYRYRLGVAPIRIGTSTAEPAQREPDASIFVLQPFDKREEPVVAKVIDQTARIIQNDLATGSPVCHTYEVDIS